MENKMSDFIIMTGAFLKSALDYLTFKLFFATFFVITAFLFDPLHTQAIIAILVLIVIDFITAIFACLKTCDQIKSRKILYSAIKTSVYFLLIAAGFVAEKTIPFPVIDETIMAFLAATELISILENTSKAGYAVPQSLLKWLKEFSNKK